MTRELKPCGTTAAYRRHLRNGEDPCGVCLDANARGKQDSKSRSQEARSAEVRSILSVVPDPVVSEIDELAEAYETLEWVKSLMAAGVTQGAASLAKQRVELVSLIKRLEGAGKSGVGALDEIARKRADRLANSAN